MVIGYILDLVLLFDSIECTMYICNRGHISQYMLWLVICRIDCPSVRYCTSHRQHLTVKSGRVNIKILILATGKSPMRVWTMKIASAKLVRQYLR